MPVTRLATAGAETQHIDEISNFDDDLMIVSSTKANTGSYSFRTGTSANIAGFAFSSDQSALRMGYFLNHLDVQSGGGGTYVYLFRFMDGNTDLGSVAWDRGTDEIVLFTNATERQRISGASAGIIGTNVWYHLAFTWKTGSPGFASFYVNGVQKLNFVGTITGLADNARFVDFSSSNSWSAFAYFDDIYVDSIAGEVDSPPPSKQFLYMTPTAVGADAAWTIVGSANNWQNVDEAPPNDDTDYNKALTANLRDTYNFSNPAIPADYAIRAVIPIARVRKLDSATPSELILHAYDGSTYLEGTAHADLPTSYGYRATRFPLQPDNSAWNEADLWLMQFGMKSSGGF